MPCILRSTKRITVTCPTNEIKLNTQIQENIKITDIRGPLHKTFTIEKTPVKSENSGKHEFTLDFTIGRKLWLK